MQFCNCIDNLQLPEETRLKNTLPTCNDIKIGMTVEKSTDFQQFLFQGPNLWSGTMAMKLMMLSRIDSLLKQAELQIRMMKSYW